MNNLLPPNSVELEKRLAEANSDISALPVRIRELWDPWRCPAEFLPYLASSRSVDRWNQDWPENIKRKVIADSFFVHQHKGTHSAIKRVINAFGYTTDIQEWFEAVPQQTPGTFALDIQINDKGITEEIYNELYRLVFDAKPVSRHYFSFGLSLKTEGNLYLGSAVFDGELISIYPDLNKLLETHSTQHLFASQAESESISIYPKLNLSLTQQIQQNTFTASSDDEVISIYQSELNHQNIAISFSYSAIHTSEILKIGKQNG